VGRVTESPAGAPQRRRILVLPVEIAGYAARLQAGLREIGWDADVLDLSGDPYGYRAEPPSDPVLRALASAFRWSGRRGVVAKALVTAATIPLRVAAASRSVRRYDALVFLYGRSLLSGLDLRWARARGVRTVVVYLGSDSRPPYLSGFHLNVEHEVRWRRLRRATRKVARRVRAMERLADTVVCSPTSGQFLSQPFVSVLAIGMPVDLPAPDHAPDPRLPGAPLRILHAPSRRRQKGSDEIEAAVGRLVAGGTPVDLDSLTGVPNAVIRSRVAAADLVVDELYSDTVMGGLGVEAAAAGVPTLVFGCAGEFLRPYVEQLGLPHEQYADPGQLDVALTRAATDAEWRERVGRATEAYVRSACSPAQVANRLDTLLGGEVPAAWWVRPGEVDYVLGFGMPRDVAVAGITEYVRRYGEGALHLPRGSAALHAIRALAPDGGVSRRR
jgi:hypothetical protein